MAARKAEAEAQPQESTVQEPVEAPQDQQPEGDIEAAHQGVEHDPADQAVDLTAGEEGAEPAFIEAEDAE